MNGTPKKGGGRETAPRRFTLPAGSIAREARMSQEIDDDPVLAHMKAMLASLQSAIAHYEAFKGLRPSEGLTDGAKVSPSVVDDRPEQLGPGVFHGLSISEAAKRFLEITKKKQKTRAICDAIQKGGIETDAKNFLSNVYTTLLRNKDFIRVGSYWALADWHPTRVGTTVSKPAKKNKRGGRRARAQARPAAPAKVVDIAAAKTAAETA
jgi:hypothetical protein